MTGSHVFGSSHRLERCCLWRATAPRGYLRSLWPVELPRCHLRTPLVSRAYYDVVVPVHSLLCCFFVRYVLAERNSYDLVIIMDSLWRRHHVWPDGGSVFAEFHMSLYDPCRWVCRQLLALDPAVLRAPRFFQLSLTFSYCSYDFLREQELGTGWSPITDRTACFHKQSERAKWNIFAPDSHDTMELWAIGPHGNWVKVICACELHVFFHQYIVDIRERQAVRMSGTCGLSGLMPFL